MHRYILGKIDQIMPHALYKSKINKTMPTASKTVPVIERQQTHQCHISARREDIGYETTYGLANRPYPTLNIVWNGRMASAEGFLDIKSVIDVIWWPKGNYL